MSLPHNEIRRLLAAADRLLGDGRWGDAASAYRRALALQPGHGDAWFNLGFALRRQARVEEALEAYARALAHGARDPEVVHLNRAAILSDQLHRDDDAMCELRQAIALAPGFLPALLNLGNLHESRGERDAAIDCYQRLLADQRADADGLASDALARLLELQPPTRLDDPLLRRARDAMALPPRPDTDPGTRASLLFSIGRACDALGDVDAAFSSFLAGKRLAHQGHPPYDPARDRRRTEALIAASRNTGAVAAGAGDGPEPLFICGMFRSGSTLLEQVLAAHPDVVTAGELDLLPRLVAGPLAPFPASLAMLDSARCSALAADYRTSLRARLPGHGEGRRFATDKRPDNVLLIGLAKRLFPQAKILHTTRHPLDNALSVFMQHLNPRTFDYAGSLEGIATHYGEQRRLMAHWKTLYPDDVFEFDYDAFVASPEATLRPLLAFLGLPWHAECLAFHRVRNTVRTASHWQVRRPLYTDASGRWRRYREHLAPAARVLDALGVDIPGDTRPQASTAAR